MAKAWHYAKHILPLMIKFDDKTKLVSTDQ